MVNHKWYGTHNHPAVGDINGNEMHFAGTKIEFACSATNSSLHNVCRVQYCFGWSCHETHMAQTRQRRGKNGMRVCVNLQPEIATRHCAPVADVRDLIRGFFGANGKTECEALEWNSSEENEGQG